jgi:hypothetical protein
MTAQTAILGRKSGAFERHAIALSRGAAGDGLAGEFAAGGPHFVPMLTRPCTRGSTISRKDRPKAVSSYST